jgi:hypothetical protein
MSDIDPSDRERRLNDKDTRNPRLRLTILIIGAVLGMLLWLVLDRIIAR